MLPNTSGIAQHEHRGLNPHYFYQFSVHTLRLFQLFVSLSYIYPLLTSRGPRVLLMAVCSICYIHGRWDTLWPVQQPAVIVNHACMTQNHRFAWRVDCVRAWGSPPRVANSKSCGGRPDRNAGAWNASPGHKISLSYYVPKCDVQSGFQGPYLSLGKNEKDGSAICRRTKKEQKERNEKKDEDREITATNHRLPIWRELIKICAQRNPAVMIASRTCFLSLTKTRGDARDSCKFCVLGNKINRAWISLGIGG